jgi:hypothetical protein
MPEEFIDTEEWLSVPLTADIKSALRTFKAQHSRELDWVYEGGTQDAIKVADTLASALLKSAFDNCVLEVIK